ncbi:hypothetical protein [Burkholderia glumae]|uniref:hypothetical protein n=1 Tax=Burkholderia glumae TaxID=337 RepID=UPI0020CF7605|nr:hypothetical protein [Burkholderia glumae]MCQ0034603.1 hypothetical protein [Burkholderia glumae]MCQ0040082.1 hypothetical protein [Burkholderia glumae]
MDYKILSKEDFDAVVTGELTHYAIWLEDEIIQILADHFSREASRDDFVRLILRRDGLSFQSKIDIVRAAAPLFRDQSAAGKLKGLLKRVEEFKAFRNAFAHGLDRTPDETKNEIHIGLVNRAGRETIQKVTPQSHTASLESAEILLSEVRAVREALAAQALKG